VVAVLVLTPQAAVLVESDAGGSDHHFMASFATTRALLRERMVTASLQAVVTHLVVWLLWVLRVVEVITGRRAARACLTAGLTYGPFSVALVAHSNLHAHRMGEALLFSMVLDTRRVGKDEALDGHPIHHRSEGRRRKATVSKPVWDVAGGQGIRTRSLIRGH